jgi:hypothetical protein
MTQQPRFGWADLLAAKLDAADGRAIKPAHDALLDHLRRDAKACPDWNAYPRARAIFTQLWP